MHVHAFVCTCMHAMYCRKVNTPRHPRPTHTPHTDTHSCTAPHAHPQTYTHVQTHTHMLSGPHPLPSCVAYVGLGPERCPHLARCGVQAWGVTVHHHLSHCEAADILSPPANFPTGRHLRHRRSGMFSARIPRCALITTPCLAVRVFLLQPETRGVYS